MNRDSSRKQAVVRALHAKLYTLRKRANPLFPERTPGTGSMAVGKGSRLKRLAAYALPIIGVGACLAVPATLSVGPWLRINDVVVTGAVLLDGELLTQKVRQEIEGTSALVLRNNHPWFIPQDKIVRTLTTDYPIASVALAKRNGVLEVTIVEKLFIVGIKDQTGIWHVMDHAGVIMRAAEPGEIEALQARSAGELPPEESPVYAKQFALIVIDGQHLLTTGETLLDADIMAGVASFHELATQAGLHILGYHIDDPKNQTWLRAKLVQGYEVYFDPRKDILGQLNALQSVLREVVPTRETVEYIDVRFGERVFIK
jgi:hypothetical protein